MFNLFPPLFLLWRLYLFENTILLQKNNNNKKKSTKIDGRNTQNNILSKFYQQKNNI